jgi:metal-sulfur cluster biosynthetic enzyme
MSPATAAATMGTGRDVTASVWTALGTVRDPELDRPITDLKFVSEVSAEDGHVRVRLRLPTYFCAPNFAYLMVADAYDAVIGVPGVTAAEVILEDHFAADQINQGVAAQAGFVKSFDGEAVAELGDLRAQFLRKAVMAGTDQVCRPLTKAGVTAEELTVLTLGALPPTEQLQRLKRRRAELGLPSDDDAPLLVDPATGQRISAQAVPLHLRKARVTRAGIEANTSICSGMFKVRYPDGWTP